MIPRVPFSSFLQWIFLIFVVLPFLSLGSNLSSRSVVQSILGGLIFAGSFVIYRREIGTIGKNPAFLCLAAFLVYLVIRSGAVLLGLVQVPGTGIFPLKWFVGFGVFFSTYFHFTGRKKLRQLLWTGAFSGFFLALNALPALLRSGLFGYVDGEGRFGFFYPLFYFHPLIEKYLLARVTHVNYIGDLVGIGFFFALGLLSYSVTRFEKKKISVSSLGIPAVILLATAGSLFLFLARGTILSFGAGLAAYFLILIFKFRILLLRVLTAAVGLGVMISLLWIVNPQKVWREMATVRQEWDPAAKDRSLASNEEGARRALAIFKDHPLWGVGTGGFEKVSKDYASEEVKKGLREAPFIVQSVAMSHYLQVLAEEGIGAFLYFLFLLAYGLEISRGLLKTQSRFQFLAGLSLSCGVAMILTHASIHYLMEQFSISLLIYALMGASLRVLRADFRRD